MAVLCTLAAAPGSAQVLSGSYTGDGTDSRQATPAGDELGFQPDVIILKGNTAQTAVIRTSTMTGDNAKPMTGATALTANLIESLDASGFTVGSDARANSNAVAYYWVAFKQAAKRMTVGTYTGNGVSGRTVTGVGFSPDLVFVMSAAAAEAVYRSTADTEAFNFATNSGNTTWITALGADGFTVGSDARVNANGVTYHYVAWNEVAGVMDVGTYTGSGGDNRNLTSPAFRPEYVFVNRDGTNQPVHHPASLGPATDDSLFFGASTNAPRHPGSRRREQSWASATSTATSVPTCSSTIRPRAARSSCCRSAAVSRPRAPSRSRRGRLCRADSRGSGRSQF